MPGRKYTAGSSYRYGFNGKENDNDVKNVEGGQQDYGMRIYDPRIGRFLSTDPITSKYPELTPYQFASNIPIRAIDLDGLEAWTKIKQYFQDPTHWWNQRVSIWKNGQGPQLTPQQSKDVKEFCERAGNNAMLLWGHIELQNSLVSGPKGTPTSSSTIAIQGEESSIGLVLKNNISNIAAEGKVIFNQGVTNPNAKSLAPIKVSDKFYEILGESEIRDSKNALVGTVSNSGGNLNLYIKTTETEYAGKGPEIFNALVKHAESKGNVQGINGTWSAGSLGSNLRAFNKAIKAGLTPEEAAFKTFTGENAQKLGYKNVVIHTKEGSSGNYNFVSLTFTK